MATNVGSVIFDVEIDTKKFARQAKDVENRAEGIGKNISQNVSKGSGSAMAAIGKLTTFAKVSAVAIGAAFTAAVGKFVIGGGISRALNIEDAQAKLRGLGHDAQSVSKIMESALASVKGTAYGLDSAATIAASAVAAGIKPGQELTKYLGLTADAATIAGVSLSEMGSIFNKVQTGQRAYTMELNQLADRGIPIYQWLQQELGVSQEALRDMVAAGQIDSATYFKVIQKNIGGAALESGKTTRGAWANMQAAMARVGAKIVENIIPKVRDAFGDMTEWIDKNSGTIIKVVEAIIPIMAVLAGAFAAATLTALAFSAAAAILAITGPQVIAVAIVALIAALVFLEVKFGFVTTVLNYLKDGFIQFWEVIKPVREYVANNLISAFNSLKESFITIYKTLEPHKEQLLQVAKIIGGALVIGIAVGVAAIILFIVIISKVIATVASVISKLVEFGVKAFNIFTSFAGTVAEKVGEVITTVEGIKNTVVDAFKDAGSFLIDAGKQVIDGFINGIKSKAGDVKSTLGGLTDKLPSWKGPMNLDKVILKDSGRAVIDGFVKGLESSYGQVKNTLSGLTGDLGDVSGNYSTPSVNAVQPDTTGGASAGAGGQVNVTLNMSGIMARSRSDLRDIGKDMITAVNEELRAKGRAELAI